MTESGFVKGQSDNLPKIDAFMMSEYFATNLDFTSAEIKGVKAARSERESYGDSAVGYVQVKREGDICTVKARITPEHNVRVKCYTVTTMCNEKEGSIISVDCEDCAAHLGGCKHVIAMLAWLHRRSEDPPSTSVACYWKKSKLSSIGTSLKFIKAKDMSNTAKSTVVTKSSDSFLSIVQNHSKMVSDLNNQLMKYYKEPSSTEKLSIHHLVISIQNKPSNPQDFIQFCKQMMDPCSCERAVLETVDQKDCPLWHELRYARITASKAYEAAHCKTLVGTVTEAIMGAKKLRDTDAMKRGRLLENEVLNIVGKAKKIKINKCGIILNANYPIIGASPDGLTDEYSIEIKCPSTKKAMSTYITKDNKATSKFMAQVQLQMHFSNKAKALFCVAHHDFELTKNVIIIEVEYNKEICENLLKKCTLFWCDTIYPFLFK